MKNRKIPVSLYILIPLIFAGVSLISALIAHNLTLYYRETVAQSLAPVYWWIIIMALLTLLCSVLVLSRVLKPVMRFVKISEKMPIFPSSEGGGEKNIKADPAYYAEVFDKITDILDKVEAKELFPAIVGQSLIMRNLFSQMLKAAPTDATVLLLGESGTGKELVATALYEHSRRRGKPFVKVNCVAIPEGLLESELFGHEKGAFTGAIREKQGKFELADGGTIFFDEIGDMPPATQAKMLRVLQEREFDRVGGAGSIQVDVRIIAATNKNLTDMVKTGAFREDLFYRLNVFNIHLPALRERREDIPALVDHFLGSVEKGLRISPRAMQLLLGHPWPGNVRELQNVIERAAVIAEGSIEPGHLPPELHGDAGVPANRRGADEEKPLDERLAEIEKGMIIEALTRAGGIQARAAQMLGINQRSLWHRIKKYNIDAASLKKATGFVD